MRIASFLSGKLTAANLGVAALSIIVTVLLFSATTPVAWALDQNYEDALVARAAATLGHGAGPLAGAEPGGPDVIKCATPLMYEIKMNWPNLSEPTRQKLAGVAILGRPDSTMLNEKYDFSTRTPSSLLVRIHYTRTGPNAVNMSYGVGNDSVPNYVLRCAALMDTVVWEEVTTLNYRTPVPDQLGRPSEDPRFDIYLLNLGSKFYGLTNPDTLVFDGQRGIYMLTSYMEISSDYSQLTGYEHRPFDAMAVTMAHEFFHSIQWTYDAEEAEFRNNAYYSWFNEVSSTWMEDVVFDRVNDFYSYLPNFFHFPWISLRVIGNNSAPFPDQFHPYAACIWGMFLTERYDVNVMHDIWERCGQVRGFNTFEAFNSALQKRGTTFPAAWAEFVVWNYFTGSRARSWSYRDGAAWSNVPGMPNFDGKISDTLVAHYSAYPVSDSTSRDLIPRVTDELAGAYMSFIPPRSDTAINFNFQLTPGFFNQWMVVTAGIQSSGKPAINYSSDFFHTITLPDWTKYDEVLVVVSPFKQSPNEQSLDRTLAFHYAVQDTFESGDNFSTSVRSNPLVLKAGESAKFQVDVLLNDPLPVTMYIYTVDGELVRGAPDPGMSFAAGLKKVNLLWDGTNRDGKAVASGVYLALVRMGGRQEVIKVAVRNER